MLLLIAATLIALVVVSGVVFLGDSGLIGESPEPSQEPPPRVAEIAAPRAKEAAQEAQEIIYREIKKTGSLKSSPSTQNGQKLSELPSSEWSEVRLDERQFKEVITRLRDRGYEIANSDEFEAFLRAEWLSGKNDDR